jgi:hypothetical protein
MRGVAKTYSAYIDRYVRADPPPSFSHPGEHHFVATYLLPHLNRITRVIPYFVNPDGMKRVPGDVVYFSGNRLTLSVEVKYCQIRLTAREFNAGICGTERVHWPTVFLGICENGIYLATWAVFRRRYLQTAYPEGAPQKIASGKYGRLRPVARFQELDGQNFYPHAESAREALRNETTFLRELQKAVRSVAA